MKIGVIGVGHLGNFHLKQLSEIPDISVSGFYDIDQNRVEAISKAHKISSFSSLESLLDSSDAVSVVTPTSLHYNIAIQALNAGCHVFIEKPITDNLSHAGALLNKADELKKIIQVGHIERFNPAFMALKKTDVEPHFIETHRLAPFNPRGNDVPVILDLMIHDLDIILSLVNSKIQDMEESDQALNQVEHIGLVCDDIAQQLVFLDMHHSTQSDNFKKLLEQANEAPENLANITNTAELSAFYQHFGFLNEELEIIKQKLSMITDSRESLHLSLNKLSQPSVEPDSHAQDDIELF